MLKWCFEDMSFTILGKESFWGIFGAKTLKRSMPQGPNVCGSVRLHHPFFFKDLQGIIHHPFPCCVTIKFLCQQPSLTANGRCLMSVNPGDVFFARWFSICFDAWVPNTFLLGMTKSNFAEEKHTYHYHHRACFCLQQPLLVENNSFWDFPKLSSRELAKLLETKLVDISASQPQETTETISESDII